MFRFLKDATGAVGLEWVIVTTVSVTFLGIMAGVGLELADLIDQYAKDFMTRLEGILIRLESACH